MPRPRTRLSVEQRRAQLLALGVDLFSRVAYDAVSTDDIAMEAGVSKGLLFHYFGNKRGFYVDTMREVARQIVAQTQPEAGASTTRAIRGAVARFLAFVRDNAGIYRSLLRGGIGVDPQVQAIVEGVRQTSMKRVFDVLGMTAPPPALRMAVYGWVGLCEAVSLDWVDRGCEVTQAEVEELIWAALGSVLSAAHSKEIADAH